MEDKLVCVFVIILLTLVVFVPTLLDVVVATAVADTTALTRLAVVIAQTTTLTNGLDLTGFNIN